MQQFVGHFDDLVKEEGRRDGQMGSQVNSLGQK